MHFYHAFFWEFSSKARERKKEREREREIPSCFCQASTPCLSWMRRLLTTQLCVSLSYLLVCVLSTSLDTLCDTFFSLSLPFLSSWFPILTSAVRGIMKKTSPKEKGKQGGKSWKSKFHLPLSSLVSDFHFDLKYNLDLLCSWITNCSLHWYSQTKRNIF